MSNRPLDILWIEDSSDDVDLFMYAVKKAQVSVKIDLCMDGEEAMSRLLASAPRAAQRPDLILLDLNLPKKDGREILAEIKQTEHLRTIPVIILTTSDAEM